LFGKNLLEFKKMEELVMATANNDVRLPSWGWWMFAGLLLIIGGLILLSSPVFASIATVLVIGAFLVAAGIIHFISSFFEIHSDHFWAHLGIAIITLIVGLLMLLTPKVTLVALTLLIAAFFLINGVFRIISSMFTRFRGWGWVLLNGIISLLLGILITIQWPASSFWVIGLFVGIDLIFTGLSFLMISLFFKRRSHLVVTKE
jgi:uncharacterized membrane protein HdeD (DUF308 family)